MSEAQGKAQHTPVRHKAVIPKGVKTLHEMYEIGTDDKTLCISTSRSSVELIVRAVNAHQGLVAFAKKQYAETNCICGIQGKFKGTRLETSLDCVKCEAEAALRAAGEGEGA